MGLFGSSRFVTMLTHKVLFLGVALLLSCSFFVSCGRDAVDISVNDSKVSSLFADRYEDSMSTMTLAINGENPLVLLHFSDIHGSLENGKRIMCFYDSFKDRIDDALCTGDLVSYCYTDDFDYWNQMGADPVLLCIGNHDSSDSSYDWGFYSSQECYSRYFDPYVSQWDIDQPPATTNNVCYYNKDYRTNNIRLIVLDCMHFDTDQKEWLVDVLEDARNKGLSVICADHFPVGPIKHISNCFDADFSDDVWLKAGNAMLRSMVTGFPKQVIPIVDSFIKSGGDFITWLFGHTHKDIFGYVDGYQNQLCIGVAESLWRKGYTGRYGDVARKYGEKSQDLFNVVSFYPNNKIIKLLRIGADVNDKGQKRYYLNWDYKNNKQLD